MATAAPDGSAPATHPPRRSDELLAALRGEPRVLLATHANPDPDALASMLGLRALLDHDEPDRPVRLILEGMIARAENQAMVELLRIPLAPIDTLQVEGCAVVLVDTQPRDTMPPCHGVVPRAVIDHHETPGQLQGVRFVDIRPDVGATSTIILSYLRERGVPVDARLATALFYGIESEISGYPREATAEDDRALEWLFPRCDRDLIAQIRNPRLPRSYFATFQHALANAFVYGDVIVSYCGVVPQPDIIAELADFFIRFDQVDWALAIGVAGDLLKMSLRSDHIGAHCGEVLREMVDGLGSAGGHDKRAGGAIPLPDHAPQSVERLLRIVRQRFLARLRLDEAHGRRLLATSPVVPVP
jgi:nanoRNase/pAp phosphatase (c-di-AMP/oligoRNAs hydrolase)